MKTKYFIVFSFLFSFIYSVSVTFHQSEKYLKTKNPLDAILGLKVECPNKGVMKNFKLLDDGQFIYYNFVCYSSKSERPEEDDYSVLKTLMTRSTNPQILENTELSQMTKFKVLCPLDSALNSFWFEIKDGNTILYSICVNVKPLTESKDLPLTTLKATVSSLSTLEGLIGITVGEQVEESSDVKGIALRGFQLVVSGNDVWFNYGTVTLKDMESIRNKYLSAITAYKNNNNQKY